MKAIYKRELKSYFVNMSGPIAIAVMLFVVGLMFWVYNVYYQVASYGEYSVSGAALLFYAVVPVLTMRCFSEEKKQKTDQILLTSPVSIPSIVMGKYLALITVFAIPTAIMCALPIIVKAFGATTFLRDYATIIAFFLMGCAYLSIGMFFSTLTESQIIAVILSILFVFVTQMVTNVTNLMSSGSFVSLVFIVVLLAILGLIIYLMTKNYWISLISACVLIIGACVFYHFNSSWFAGKAGDILGVLDFSSTLSSFSGGTLDITGYVRFLSFIAIGIILSIVSIQKRRWS